MNKRKLAGTLKISENEIVEESLDSNNKKRSRKILGEIRNPITNLCGLGLLETYTTRIEVGHENEVEEILVNRHLCGQLKIIDDIDGRQLVDQWTDRDNFLRRRIIYGRVSISTNCTEKINFFERNEKNGKKIDRKIGGSIRAVAEEGGGRNRILEEVLENGELVPVLEILGEVVFKRDDLSDKLMLGESVG